MKNPGPGYLSRVTLQLHLSKPSLIASNNPNQLTYPLYPVTPLLTLCFYLTLIDMTVYWSCPRRYDTEQIELELASAMESVIINIILVTHFVSFADLMHS
jgi:hypothetical protein